MPSVFWSGKLSFLMKLMVNTNNLLAWIFRNTHNTAAMKQRMKLGYEGQVSDSVSKYDELGMQHYTKIATALLDNVPVQGMNLIDVGCGTGILSLIALNLGAHHVTGGD